jgi:hypothetical protein
MFWRNTPLLASTGFFSSLAYTSTLKIKVLCSFTMSGFLQNTWYYNQDDDTLQEVLGLSPSWLTIIALVFLPLCSLLIIC